MLDALDRTGATNNTLVMFLSDNGGCAGFLPNLDKVLPGSVDTFDYVAQG